MNRRPHCHGTESTTTSSTVSAPRRWPRHRSTQLVSSSAMRSHRASGSTATSPQANNERWPGTTDAESSQHNEQVFGNGPR